MLRENEDRQERNGREENHQERVSQGQRDRNGRTEKVKDRKTRWEDVEKERR